MLSYHKIHANGFSPHNFPPISYSRPPCWDCSAAARDAAPTYFPTPTALPTPAHKRNMTRRAVRMCPSTIPKATVTISVC